MSLSETLGVGVVGNVFQRQTLDARVWRKCSCGLSAPAHGINIVTSTESEGRLARCPNPQRDSLGGCYDGVVENLGTRTTRSGIAH